MTKDAEENKQPDVTPESEYAHHLRGRSDVAGHLKFMYDTVRSYTKPQVIELGVGWGNSTSGLLAAIQKNGGALFSCDIEDPKTPDEFSNCPDWTFLKGDELSPEVQAQMPVRCDVLFIDSDPGYDHLMAVLRAYVPRMKKDGTVMVHDTEWQWPDVQLAGPSSSVARALGDYCAEAGLSWENRAGSFGLGVIRL